MIDKKCFLLFCKEDIFFYKKFYSNNNTDLILMEKYLIYYIDKGTDYKFFHDFYDKIEDKQEEVAYLALNWYRNVVGDDTFENDQISLPKVATGSLLTKFSHYYRDYNCLKSLLKKYEFIYKPQNTGFYFENIFNNININIENYTSFFDCNFFVHQNSFNERKLITPKFNKAKLFYFFFFNFISTILLKFKIGKNKNLIFSDWSYSTSSDIFNNYLFFGKNSFNPLKYTIYHIHKIKFNLKITKSKLKFTKQNTPLLFSYLDWDEELLSILRNYVLYYFSKNIQYISYYFEYFNKLFSLYEPRTITIPADSHEYYAILLQLANRKGIKSYFLSDGILYHENLYHFVLKNKNNSKFLFDEVFAISNFNKNNYLKMGFPQDKITIIKHPLLNHYKKVAANRIVEDVIILNYTPYDLNPYATISTAVFILNDIIQVLISLGFNKIHIKLKSSLEENFTKLVISKYLKINFILLYDSLYTVLTKYKFNIAIGQSSTAVSEFHYIKDTYFIYEPYTNGLKLNQDFETNNYNSVFISRDTITLFNNLQTFIKTK